MLPPGAGIAGLPGIALLPAIGPAAGGIPAGGVAGGVGLVIEVEGGLPIGVLGGVVAGELLPVAGGVVGGVLAAPALPDGGALPTGAVTLGGGPPVLGASLPPQAQISEDSSALPSRTLRIHPSNA